MSTEAALASLQAVHDGLRRICDDVATGKALRSIQSAIREPEISRYARERRKLILRMRQEDNWTYKQIGDVLGVDRERARQLCNRALRDVEYEKARQERLMAKAIDDSWEKRLARRNAPR